MTETAVREQYDRLAARYDRRWRWYVTQTLTFLHQWAQLDPEETVLDIACGTGEFERLVLAEQPHQNMIGVDLSDNMLAIARYKCQEYPNVSFQIANAEALPFADGTFDAIVSASAFHYFDRPQVALLEMRRVLELDGRVVILDWCRDFLFCRICDFLLKLLDPAHKNCYTQEEFHKFLLGAGFTIQNAQRIRFGWVWGLMVATAYCDRPSQSSTVK